MEEVPKNGCCVLKDATTEIKNDLDHHQDFRIGNVIRSLESALDGQNSTLLQHYIDAFAELKKLFSKLGVVFSFVETDLHNKHGILAELLKSDPDNYGTVERMVYFECFDGQEPPQNGENNVGEGEEASEERDSMQQQQTGGVVRPKAAGSRTLLRLHRSLAFLIRFVELVQKPSPESAPNLFRLAYTETLSPHHTWYIRASVQWASPMVPCRSQLIKIIFGTAIEGKEEKDDGRGEMAAQECVDQIAERFLEVTRMAFDRVQAFFLRHGLLELP